MGSVLECQLKMDVLYLLVADKKVENALLLAIQNKILILNLTKQAIFFIENGLFWCADD